MQICIAIASFTNYGSELELISVLIPQRVFALGAVYIYTFCNKHQNPGTDVHITEGPLLEAGSGLYY